MINLISPSKAFALTTSDISRANRSMVNMRRCCCDPIAVGSVFASVLVLFLFGNATAQGTPEFCIFPYQCPTAARVSPQVGRRGTTVKLLLQGGRLQEIQDLLFYSRGLEFVSSRPVDTVPHDVTQQPKSTPAGTASELTLHIAPDCPLGEHLFRVRTSDQLSEMLTFWVTPFPCVAESHLGHDVAGNTNGDIEHAQLVPLGASVYGYHPQYATIDHDYYAVDLTKGQRLTVEVWSSCLGFQFHGGMSDIAVTLYGPDGEKIAYEDDSYLRDMDPILNVRVPESGRYYVNIHQNMDFEGILRHYVAHISNAARPLVTYPLGGRAGTFLEGVTIGDVGGPKPFRLKLPEQPGAFEESMMSFYSSGSAIPNGIQVAGFSNVMEDGEDHFSPEMAQVHSGDLPVAFNGRIEHEGKTDWYRFTAKKGERYRVKTYAAALGSFMDPTLSIRPSDPTKSRINITGDDSNWIDHDWWGNNKVWIVKDRMDPVVVFEPDVDGDFFVGINDAQRLFGPQHVYRIEFQPLKDHAFIYFPTDYRESPHKRDRFVIPRNNTIEHTLAIIPATGNRYRGGMRVIAEGLPKGVTFSCPPLKPGQKLTQAVLHAGPDAEEWTGLIDLKLEPTEADADFSGSFVHNVPTTQRRGGNSVVFNRVRRLATAVVQEAPIHVSVKQPVIGLAQNAVIDLDVEVRRHGDFEGPVRVFAAWTPPGVSVTVPLVIPAGETRGTYRLSASDRVAPGNYTITLTAREELGGERAWGTGFHFVASPPIRLQVVRPYLEIQLARTAVERQKTGRIRATIKTISPLPGPAKVKLVRLPRGVESIGAVTIRPGDTDVEFPIRVTKDCLIGLYKEIGCEISIVESGQTITQQTGNGALRVDAERG